MSYNRLRYDQCEYKQTLMQSVAPLQYIIDPIKYEHCSKCRPELGVVGGTAVSHITGNLIDLENDLRGQTRPHSHCPQYNYIPPSGSILTSQEQYKPVQHPPIDLSMRHLPTCQFIDYPQVPNVPLPQPVSCALPVSKRSL